MVTPMLVVLATPSVLPTVRVLPAAMALLAQSLKLVTMVMPMLAVVVTPTVLEAVQARRAVMVRSALNLNFVMMALKMPVELAMLTVPQRELAQLAADLLRTNPRLEVHAPVLSIVTFRHRQQPHETEADRALRDTKLMEATLASGELMLSTTTLAHRTTLRLVVMNHRTTAEEVQRSVAQIHKLTQ